MIQNPMQMIQMFNQFKNNYHGNAQDEVKKLLTSGKLSQAQLNELQAMANELQKILSR